MKAPTFNLDAVMWLYHFGGYSAFENEDGTTDYRCNCCGWVYGSEPTHETMVVRSIDGSQSCPVVQLDLEEIHHAWENGLIED